MNKLLIVLLAVCLVSTQAFVKRDAPADHKNYLETIQKQIQDFGKSVNTQVSQAFNPNVIKKNFNDFVDGVTNTTHTFVKRHIPTSADMEAQLAAVKTNIEQLFNKLKEEATKNLNPDTIKKNFNNLIDATKKAVNSFAQTTEATKPAA